MGTRSAGSWFCVNSSLLLLAAWLGCGGLRAQLGLGRIEGAVRTAAGSAMPAVGVVIEGGGLRLLKHTDGNGRFALALPYGRYRISLEGDRKSGAPVDIAPLGTVRVTVVVTPGAPVRIEIATAAEPGVWTGDFGARVYPEGFSLGSALFAREPGTVTEPLDFAGLADNRLGVISQRGFSWTDTAIQFNGLDAGDDYQPGSPQILPDGDAVAATVVRSAFGLTPSTAFGAEIGLFPAQAGESWHAAISSAGTAGALASNNLPPAAGRGAITQSEQYDWFTRDHAELGGPLSRWADVFVSGSGLWAAQAAPLAAPGTNQNSRLLFGNALGHIRAGAHDRFDALYSGSRIDLAGWGEPAGMEALAARRLSPEFLLPDGVAGLNETDHLDFVQAGWTHVWAASAGGTLQVRYGDSFAHLDTAPAVVTPINQSSIEMAGGAVTGEPPLTNLAVRARQQIAAAWEPGSVRRAGANHQFMAGGGWRTSSPQNRYRTPSDLNLITADGVPAEVVEFDTPLDSRERITSASVWATDHMNPVRRLTLDLGLMADFSRGGVPAQSSPFGIYTPARQVAAQSNLIAWNSVSPRAGLAWQVPHAHGLVMRGAFFRLYAPLAGRYLDYGNPNSLGGSVYQWNDLNGDGWFEPGEQGALLARFGGPYSSISPTLRRPYADEWNLGAEMPLPLSTLASIHLFRRDEKDRIAAIDTGVTPQDFTPVTILDPGPDGIPGTFDDQQLTVYAQNPATLGHDHYLLTNPPGLRTLNSGVNAQLRTAWRGITVSASFVAEKSYGPTNPGNAIFENDPGVVGALFSDPNAQINSTGRAFTDRAFTGKIEALYRLPARWGGVQISTVADYTDGLAFARMLLVTGLPQGPFLVATTPRGSPGGGNRAEHVQNWNLRLSREWPLAFGRIAAAADLLNVTNADLAIQQADLTGPTFNSRLPIAIEPPRFMRFEVRYRF
ncbi:MAG: hypothetical protein ABSE35_13515 [Bryobacteraceae bacterium]